MRDDGKDKRDGYIARLTCIPLPRLERDELSDDELCEAAEDDDEEEDSKGAVGGTRVRAYTCAESALRLSARLSLYDNQEWRMEVGN